MFIYLWYQERLILGRNYKEFLEGHWLSLLCFFELNVYGRGMYNHIYIFPLPKFLYWGISP
jgi:hypothetical protein